MGRLSLLQKFITLALLIVTLVASLGAITVYQFNQLAHNEIARAKHAQSFDTSAKKVLDANVKFKIQIQHWKNILLRGNQAADFDAEKGQFEEKAARVQILLAEAIQSLDHSEDIVLDVGALMREHENLTAQYLAALKNFDANDPNAGKIVDRLVRGNDKEFTLAMEESARRISERSTAQIGLDSDETRAEIKQALKQYLLIAIPGIIVLMILLWYFCFNILQQIGGDPEQARRLAKQIVAGNLTVKMDRPKANSILGQLQQMADWLSDTITELRYTSHDLNLLSQQVQTGAANVLQATEKQAKAIEVNSSALEQIAATVAQNAVHAQKLERLIQHSPEMQELVQEIIYASKEQAQSIQLANKNLQTVALTSSQNTTHSRKLSDTASLLAVEAENINAVFEAFQTE